MSTMSIGAPKTEYYLIGNNPVGVHLWFSRDYISIQGAVAVNNVGSMVFYLPAVNYRKEDLPIEGIVELWRAPLGLAPKLFSDRLWIIRERYKEIKGGQRVWRVVCYDMNYLMGSPSGQSGRVIAYNPGNSFTAKLDEADDMAKAIIRENMGSLASDTNRSLAAYLTVQADLANAAIIRKEFSRRLILPTLQELAQASYALGTYMAFDIVCTAPPSVAVGAPTFSIEFRTYTGQRGVDHRASSADPVLIGPDFGNMDNVTYGTSHVDEANYIYAIGMSVADVASVLPIFDQSLIDLGPFNRRELVVNAENSVDLESIEDEANAALKANRPRNLMSGSYIDSDQARFDDAWGYGDFVTAQIDGEAFDCRNEAVGFEVNASGGESIQIILKGEDDD